MNWRDLRKFAAASAAAVAGGCGPAARYLADVDGDGGVGGKAASPGCAGGGVAAVGVGVRRRYWR